MEKKLNPTTDTTKFVNVFDKPYDIYIDGKLVRHLEPGEEQILPLFVAQVGAKHLADKVLYKKGIKDVNRPSEIRDQILAKILPDLQEEVKVKPLSNEEFRKKVDEALAKQNEQIKALGGEKDKEISKLRKELKALKKADKKT